MAISAVVPGEPRQRRDPGSKSPGIRKKARQGYMDPGSRCARNGCGVVVMAIAAVIPGEPRQRRDPGSKSPGMRKKGETGVHGSRLSLRSAGMTAEKRNEYTA